MTHPQIHRHTIKDGDHADLAKINIRLPQHIAAQVQALAKAQGQSLSLYMARLVEKHVGDS